MMRVSAFSGVVLVAATFFCPDTALAQQVRRTTHTATPVPVGGTATATAAPSVLQDLLDRIIALESQTSRISTLEAQVAQLQSDLAAETTARMNADVMMCTVIMQHMDLLQHFSRDGNDITISGANLHVVNGTGSTDGPVNGLGNVIVGYNELRGDGSDDRNGSHMLVAGKENNYTSSSFGGIVVGLKNTTSGNYSSVSGGGSNTASGFGSSVSGGGPPPFEPERGNLASGAFSSVSGGWHNTASGQWSSITGGRSSTASGEESSVSGGEKNVASGENASISGGFDNTASSRGTSVSGGSSNVASNEMSSVTGGFSNRAEGRWSSVSGGRQRIVTGIYDWMAGLLFQDM